MRSRARALGVFALGLPDNVRGALWVMGSACAFAGMGAITRGLGDSMSAFQVAFFRAWVGAVVLLPFVVATEWRTVLVPRRPGLMAVRTVVGLLAMACVFHAFTALPLATATSISFTRPLFLIVLAVAFLGEGVEWRRWTATVVGFAGVVVMLGPGGPGLALGAAAALAGALLVAVVQVLIKKLTAVERPLTMMVWFAVPAAAVMAVPAGVLWVPPTDGQLALLVLAGGLGSAGQYMAVRGFRAGEATAVVPFDYLQIPIAGVLGFVLFTEVPGWNTVAGIGLIAASTLYILRREAGRQLVRNPG